MHCKADSAIGCRASPVLPGRGAHKGCAYLPTRCSCRIGATPEATHLRWAPRAKAVCVIGGLGCWFASGGAKKINEQHRRRIGLLVVPTEDAAADKVSKVPAAWEGAGQRALASTPRP